MIEFTLLHDFDVTPAQFWALYLDPAFTRTLLLEGLGFGTAEIEPVVDRDGKRSRSMRVQPKLELPAAVAKVLGPKLGYTETGRLDVARSEWSYEIAMSVLTERIRLGGRMKVEPLGERRCHRTSVLWVEVRILGVGGLIEKAAEKNMRDGWEKAAVWVADWIRRNPPA
ncbi:MAG: DUF2505 domain-containing protein [Nannocystaceae bacterium]|nr:DUF2505 domain-containing protein [Nannocystaceae bacterium]